MKKNNTLLLIGALVILSLVGFYLSRQEIPTKFEIKKDQTYWVYGTTYQGKIDQEAFGLLFKDAEKIIAEKNLKASAGAIYTVDVTDKRKQYVNAFVGIISEDSLAPIPTLKAQKFHYKKVVSATQESNPFFNNMYNQLTNYVEKEKLAIDKTIQIEIYLSEEKIRVDLPLK